MSQDKCPDCHKYWETTWKGTRFCPSCGQTPEQAQAKGQAKLPSPKPPRHVAAKLNAAQEYALALTDRLYTDHLILGHEPTVFRARLTSYVHSPRGLPQIVFGYQSVNRAHDLGFSEYVSISYVWDSQGDLKGMRGVWALALHEFAHVQQFRKERLYSRTGHRNKYHNEQFVAILRDLQAKYPFGS